MNESPKSSNHTQKEDHPMSESLPKPSNKLFLKLSVAFAMLFAGFFLVLQVVDTNDADTSIVLQSITGDLSVINDAGPYLRFFGKPHPYKKVVSVNFTGGSKNSATSNLESIKIRFLDTSMGDARGVARFRLPSNEKELINIHREFGGLNGLMANLVERMVIESAKASARTMSVEQHYSGGAGQMTLDFDDQLRKGIFVLDQVVESLEVEPETDTNEKGNLKNRQRVLVLKKTDENGEYVRTQNQLAEYSISVVSASIEDVDYEPRVDERLAAQKQAAADEALARQNLKKAQQEAKTAEALGEKAIAEARAIADREKLEAEIKAQKEASVSRINAERQVEVARQEKLMQNEILERQRKEAEGLEVMANARKKAAENALDPQQVFDQKLKAWKDVEIAKYQYMSKANLVPHIQMGARSEGTSNNALTMLELMGVKAAMDLGVEFQDIGKKTKPN